MDPDKICAAVAVQQYGLVARFQAVKAGMSRAAIGRRLSSGQWMQLFPGVYRMAGNPETWLQRLKGVCLWAGPKSAISHRTAAALHGLEGFRASRLIDVTTPRRLRGPGVVIHLIRESQPVLVTDVKGIRVTTVTWTLTTLGKTETAAKVEDVLDESLRRGMTDLARVKAVLRKHGGHGRRGAGVLAGILERRTDEDTRTDSVLEDRLLRLLRGSGLPAPVVHYEAYTEDEWLGEVDFAYPKKRIAIEVDSHKHHSDRADWERDLKRRNLFTSHGWQVLHVTARDLKSRPEEVLRWIQRALRG